MLTAFHGRKARAQEHGVLAILGVELIDAVIDAPYPLGPERFAKEVQLLLPFSSQIRKHHAGSTVPLRGVVDPIEVLVDERNHCIRHIGGSGQDQIIPDVLIVLSAQKKEDISVAERLTEGLHSVSEPERTGIMLS
jgi:hypothetical protein